MKENILHREEKRNSLYTSQTKKTKISESFKDQLISRENDF